MDVLALVCGRYWSILNAARDVYNADVSASRDGDRLFNLPLLLPENCVDERHPASRTTERTLDRMQDGAFPRLIVRVARYEERGPDKATFGYAQGNGCDIIVPTIVVLTRELYHSTRTTGDRQQWPLETYLDNAERRARPTWGIPYCGEGPGWSPTTTSRKDEDEYGSTRTVSRRTVTFALRPPLSWLAGE